MTFGACEKHPNFPMINCPICAHEQLQEANTHLESEIEKIQKRIDAGIEILKSVKEQLSVLKSRRAEYEMLKKKINS